MPKPLLRKGLGIFLFHFTTPIEFRKALQTLDQAPPHPFKPFGEDEGMENALEIRGTAMHYPCRHSEGGRGPTRGHSERPG